MIRFTKADCGEPMTTEDVRNVQLDMLNKIAEFCDRNGLRYFLSGGTLLGAIRHQGFIPWDDDIDINMPRPDCERLMQLTQGRLDDYILAEPDMDGFSLECEYYRLYDFHTVIENFSGGFEKKYPAYHPIFIDIFPIEGLPRNKRKTALHYAKIVTLRKMQRSAGLDHMVARNFAAHIFHVVSRIPAKAVGYKRWSIMIQNAAKKYSFDDAEYIGVMTAPVHTTEERVIKKDYLEPIEVMFEGKYYHAPKNYDTYLTQLYGDYMQMPPEEKRKSHHAFNMYWRAEK